jgi:hypothetical protein
MIPVSDMFLTEGVWSFIKNSIANILGKRKSINVRSDNPNDEIKMSESIHRKLIPRPLSVNRQKLGFRQIKG